MGLPMGGGWVEPSRTRKADGTHPTGMLSCCNQILGSVADANYVVLCIADWNTNYSFL